MKRHLPVISLVFLLCFASGCQDKAAMAELEAFKSQAALEEQNKAIYARYMGAWIRGDAEALKTIFSPGYVWRAPSGEMASLEQTLGHLEKQVAMFSDRTVSNEEIIAKGDRVIGRYVLEASHTGSVEGLPATGNKIKSMGIEIIRIENGRIVEAWEVFDSLGLFQQLGYELKPKATEK